MKTLDLVGTAIGSTFRSKTRTVLTILAIFIGAFTLTITNGLGTGINDYIDDTVATFGASDVLSVTKTAETAATSGPQVYDPDSVSSTDSRLTGASSTVITQDDLDTLAAIDGVQKVEPVRSVSVDYIQFGSGTKYTISAGSLVAGQTVTLAAGAVPDDASSELELALPNEYVEPLGFADADEAVGQTVTLAVSDATGAQHAVTATVTGVSEDTFSLGGSTSSMLPNTALTDAMYEITQTGLQADQQNRYAQARVWFDPAATDAEVSALQDRLTDAGFTSTTVAQQLGTFKTVIDGIVLVLNAFAIIALLAASFGIINTLYMSVQERTREIGLMKAMGMGSGRVFGLFSLEATFIGFLGSAIGVVIGMLAGTVISTVLSRTVLSDLSGLNLIAFDTTSIVSVILLVMVIAFLAGTLPALRAARKDPVEALRYE
ncbi:MAG: FtsX-like permease family protein [Microbacterium sp.]|uniref:ABC transporter permease n=1 Tax=Microbacterium sp. TaxID=51671 RepID=UPI0039E2A032